MKKVVENFREFIQSAETYHEPGVNKKYEYGNNPGEDLPFNFERRPEIGEESNDDILNKLEQMEALIQIAKNKYANTKGPVSPYIKSNVKKAYKSLREAYLRLIES